MEILQTKGARVKHYDGYNLKLLKTQLNISPFRQIKLPLFNPRKIQPNSILTSNEAQAMASQYSGQNT